MEAGAEEGQARHPPSVLSPSGQGLGSSSVYIPYPYVHTPCARADTPQTRTQAAHEIRRIECSTPYPLALRVSPGDQARRKLGTVGGLKQTTPDDVARARATAPRGRGHVRERQGRRLCTELGTEVTWKPRCGERFTVAPLVPVHVCTVPVPEVQWKQPRGRLMAEGAELVAAPARALVAMPRASPAAGKSPAETTFRLL